MNNRGRSQTRMLHIRLPAELHKRLRIRAAEDDSTLQDWVTMAIHKELEHQEERTRKTTEWQPAPRKRSVEQVQRTAICDEGI